MIATFQVDLDNAVEVAQLKELLEQRLSQLQSSGSVIKSETVREGNQYPVSESYITQNEAVVGVESMSTGHSLSDTTDNMRILRRFVSQASPNQIKVLKWMKDHPGPVSAHILKQELPFLAPHGALSGVFRPGRWVKLSGGTKEGFPFFQIQWNHEKGCGIYRGMTQEESDYIQSLMGTDENESLMEGEEL